MRNRLRVAAWISAGLALAALAGCGPLEDFPIDDGTNGPVCYDDSDCVPNACCGEGTGAVHISEAPDCRGVRCSGACDPSLIDCGCAYPYCRDGQCVKASTFSDQCG